MRTFRLEPREGTLDRPEWSTTTLKEACWVTAGDEEEARSLVDDKTGAVHDFDQDQGVNYYQSPWLLPDLTTCAQDDSPKHGPPPEAVILTNSGKTIS